MTASSDPRAGAPGAGCFAAIDFGTSNSAVAVPDPAAGGAMRLVELEPGHVTMPTAVFFRADVPEHGPEPWRLFGRAAVGAYVDGLDGRLMRSMKSILGSALVEQTTDVGGGRGLKYLDVIAGYLRHLRTMAAARLGAPPRQVVLGRPVFFVDDDPERDAAAQAALERAARSVGFESVAFQYEPIAAALDFERHLTAEQRVLVADIGGGTSDFSLVRLGPQHAHRLDRAADLLANHGVHVAGTDFDRRLSLAALMPLLGYGSRGPARPGQTPREVPSGLYFDLATWHLINTCYAPGRVAEWRQMRSWYADPRLHTRLMTVLVERWGHALAAAAEQGKIDVALHGAARLELHDIEPGLARELAGPESAAALEADLQRIVDAAVETARRAGVAPDSVDAVYFTGGSTGLTPLVDRIAAEFPRAQRVRGDAFASVASGLGVYAQRLYGAG